MLDFSATSSGVTLGSLDSTIGNNGFTLSAWILLKRSGYGLPIDISLNCCFILDMFVFCSNPTCSLDRNVTFGNPNASGPSLGIFRQSTDDEIDWTITNLESPTADTGPSEDHTGNGGFYVFLDVPFQFPFRFTLQGYRVSKTFDIY